MNKLTKAQEVQLVKSGDSARIKSYFEQFCFCEEAQFALINLKDKELIKAYVSRYCLQEKVEIAFMKLNDTELIRTYIENLGVCLLCDASEAELIRHGSKELIKFYMLTYRLREPAVFELVEREDKDLIIYYILKNCRYNEAEEDD